MPEQTGRSRTITGNWEIATYKARAPSGQDNHERRPRHWKFNHPWPGWRPVPWNNGHFSERSHPRRPDSQLAKDDQKYDRVMIVAGGNQLQDDIANVTETISSIKSTIAAAKQVGDTVSLCELPPRMNSINATEAVHALNIELKELARETECGYVETGQVFHLANGSPNDGYMDKDNIHINLRGGDKLVECLQIKLKEQNRKVTKFAAYNKKNNHPQQKKQQPKSYSKVAAGKTQKPTGSVAPKQFAPAPQGKHESKSKTIQAGRQPIADPKRKDDGRPLPIQEEFDFCGYCGEPGHRYWNCRCGGPVKCNKCGVRSHKAKFCHHYD